MTETGSAGPGGTSGGSAGDPRDARGKVADGIKQGLGVLSAFKDALEETIVQARDRGDLTPERAKEALRSALARAQEAAGDARDRLDLVSQKEFDLLKAQVEDLKRRLQTLEGQASQPGGAGAGRTEGPEG